MDTIHLLNTAYTKPRPLCHKKEWQSLSSEEVNVTCLDCKDATRRGKFGGSIVAKLIAGAPELLAALEALIAITDEPTWPKEHVSKWMDQSARANHAIHQARAAIRKARGE